MKWNLKEVDLTKIKPTKNNPKIRDNEGFKRLQKSLEKFGRVFDGILNTDFSIIDGNSRFEELTNQGIKTGMYFIPSKKLTEKEYREMNAMFDVAKAGEPDYEMIFEELGEGVMDEWELDYSTLKECVKDNLKPYNKAHILISFHPDKMMDIQKYIDKIKEIQGIEIEQSAN